MRRAHWPLDTPADRAPDGRRAPPAPGGAMAGLAAAVAGSGGAGARVAHGPALAPAPAVPVGPDELHDGRAAVPASAHRRRPDAPGDTVRPDRADPPGDLRL